MTEELRSLAREWMVHDPDRSDAERVGAMLEADDHAGLRTCFGEWLGLGPDGVQARLGPGTAQVNRALIRRIGDAVATVLDSRGTSGPVVIARDARRSGASLASEVAGVVAATGRNVVAARTPVPAAVLAFAVRSLEAAAGVMISAGTRPSSHNGVSLLGRDGIGVDDPTAEAIEEGSRLGRAASEVGYVDEQHRYARVHRLSTTTVDAYLDSIAGLRVVRDTVPLQVAHSALHGVTHRTVQRAFEVAGLTPPSAVEEQADPDPAFPTVVAPDPAVRANLDLLLAWADVTAADLAVAHDPEGTRLSAAVPGPRGWHQLSADEVGVLLADHLLRHAGPTGGLLGVGALASRMIVAVGVANGATIVQGGGDYPSVARAALDMRPLPLTMACDGSAGFGFGDRARVRDGIASAVLLRDAVAELRGAGVGPLERLDQLASEHGVHVGERRSVVFGGPLGPKEVSDRLESMADGLRGHGLERSGLAAGSAPRAPVIEWTGAGVRAVAVCSWSEGVVRLHAEVHRDSHDAARVAETRASGAKAVTELLDDIERRILTGSE